MPDIRVVPQGLCAAYKPGFFQPGYRVGKIFYLVGYAKDTLTRAQGIAQDAAAPVKSAVAMVFDHKGNNLLDEKGEVAKK